MADQKGPNLAHGHSDSKQLEDANGTQRFKQNLVDRRGPTLMGQDGKDVNGWDAYRRWLSRVQLPDKRRTSMDPSLYTWKGYRNWAEKVRRDWTPEE